MATGKTAGCGQGLQSGSLCDLGNFLSHPVPQLPNLYMWERLIPMCESGRNGLSEMTHQVLREEWLVTLVRTPLCLGRSQPSSHCSSLVSLSLPVGHGQSEGDRMVVSDFHVFIRDVLQHVDAVQKDHPGLPVFLLGHSMVSRPRKRRSRSGLWPWAV